MELFGPTIQGEGLMTGTITHFLRTGGCGLRCSWCDSMFAVDPKQIKGGRTMMTTAEILDAIQRLPTAPYITFTGGDPCLHKGLGDLIPVLHMDGMKVAVETQGEVFPEWLANCDVVTFSPKGPSSGNVVDYHYMAGEIERIWGLGRRTTQICIKIVCFDQMDFEYALNAYRHMTPQLYDAFYFTAGTNMFLDEEPPDPNDEKDVLARAYKRIEDVLTCPRGLAETLLQASALETFHHKVHLGCQQPVLLWADKNKGV